MTSQLTRRTLLSATRRLAERDPDLAAVVDTYGPPPLWAREPGFPTLVYIILEQQVSLASARAAFTRPAPNWGSNPGVPRSSAELLSTLVTSAGLSDGLTERTSAATPAAMGELKDVPQALP